MVLKKWKRDKNYCHAPLTGTVKAGFPTTLSQDIEELRKVNRKNAHGHKQGTGSPEV